MSRPIVDAIYMRYLELRDALSTRSELLQEKPENDCTELFLRGLRTRIKLGKLVNINVTGEVRSGKSVVILGLMVFVFKLLKEFGKTDEELGIGYRNLAKYICSNQIEFNRLVNTKLEQKCVCIDEWSALGKSGLGATTELSVFQYYSDVFAGRYVHRIFASPSYTPDPNANIILTTVGFNAESKTTRLELRYKETASQDVLTLGYIDLFMGDTLDSELYEIYKRKKDQAMAIMDEIGVADIRQLERPSIIKEAYRQLEPRAKISRVSQGLVKSVTKRVLREKKKLTTTSIFSEKDFLEDVYSLLEQVYYISVEKRKVAKLLYKENPEPERATAIQENLDILEENLKMDLEELDKLEQAHRKYKEIVEVQNEEE